MKKSERLSPLLKLEKNREQERVKALGDARSMVAVQMEKLQQLVDYRGEYEATVTQQGQQGISAIRLQGYHQFLNRLTAAITQQEEQVELARRQETAAKDGWFAQRGAVKRMDTLIERNVTEERREEDKREQKTLDEQAQQLRYRVNFNSSGFG